MKTKEVIEQIKNYVKALETLKEPESKLYSALKEAVALLQQGEKYRQLVKELKEFYGNGIVENESGLGVKLFNLIEILEGKYFPKEGD